MRRVIVIVVVIILAFLALPIIRELKEPPVIELIEHPEIDIFVGSAHAQSDLDPTTGCAACHTQPIKAGCRQCHSNPPTIVKGNIAFPHHDPAQGGPPDNCQMGPCHDGNPSDARFAKSPKATKPYCQQCHKMEHSRP